MPIEDRDWYREETERRGRIPESGLRAQGVRRNPRRRRRSGRGGGGGRFMLFIIACLVAAPLWMWAYHEDVPIAVDAWQTAHTTFDNVASGLSGWLEEVSADPKETSSTAREPALRVETQAKRYVDGSPLNRREIERFVIGFTNVERSSAGLLPLRHDDAISDIARSHSEDMARIDVLSHDLAGRDPTDRAMEAGYTCRAYLGDGSYTYGLSENIAEHPRVTKWRGYGSSYNPVEYDRDAEEMARGLVRGWMNSPGHRENIMDAGARRIGVGVAIQESPEYGYTSETVYATQNFSGCS